MTTATHPLWRPSSGCGPGCLPLPGRSPAVPLARQLGRGVALLGMLGLGIGLAALLPVLPARERHAATRGWARATARACGVRLTVRGRLPRRRALLVANHVSWWDILAILTVAPARLVAKQEVGRWPLVGLLARAAGTIFVDRARPRELPGAVGRVAAALRAGRSVAVFPEGTTWCGERTDCRPATGFRPAMFQAAIDTGAPVVPLRIGYRCAATGTSTSVAAFVGDDTLLRSVRRLLAARQLQVSVEIGAPLHPGADTDRRALARVAESVVHLVPSVAVSSRPAAPSAPPPQLPTQPRSPVGPPGRGLSLAA
ncbi:1-acyl-sn-glycerol-3-phosphate acyltransferase [Micromonospora zingiberis]|uniref:1-acyl-sn-glycerol-3-phosphate acyltransferase n=1 Tax=Micromonospora zingiberis TaxID=2053011 RepID=A0A4R0GQ27_9ACTN|nr:lysophospholipid acyltransferase family protein [Micromonospora zingiberis]TCB97701.1 1-acyl-sn-glycerol-3-phosphate acyltransferase [Micromonospora zingiberis]